MHITSITPLSISLLLSLVSSALSQYGRYSEQPPGKDAILLSKVQTLTLRSNRLTTSRRVPPIPQLTCTGPSSRICNMYTIETMRCTNAGYDYDEEDVQWTCTAQLPPEFKLGSTDVVCEGYRNADDKWVLKGSCGVEYRLLLTELGERRFGDLDSRFQYGPSGKGSSRDEVMTFLGNLLLFGFLAASFVWILLPMFADCFGLRRRRGDRRDPNVGRGGFWGGGGGGPGGGGDGDGYPRGPPPPYSCEDSNTFTPRRSSRGWRPGFWTGALGGTALGYGLGRRSNQPPVAPRRATSSFSLHAYNNGYDSVGSSSRSDSPPRFSATTTSTGFGSTRRR